VVFDVGVDYEADLQKARQVLLDLAKDERILAEPEPQAVISTLGDSSITVSLRVWVKTADYWDVMFMFNEQSRDRLKTAGIDIPFPQRVIRVVQESAVQ
jgi:small conductance mechanosensitive channel